MSEVSTYVQWFHLVLLISENIYPVE
jgi:hypothetical protein